MRHLLACATLLAACTVASAQSPAVYRCGNSYSQEPCPTGRAVAADDARSADQVRAARDTQQRQQQLADKLRHDRLEEERLNKPARLAAAKAAKPKAAKTAKAAHAKKQVPERWVFTGGEPKLAKARKPRAPRAGA